MRALALATALCLAAASSNALAQNELSSPAETLLENAPHWLDGTEIQLVADREISSKNTKPGSRFSLRVNAPVCFDNAIAIPAGSLAWAEVDAVDRNGGMGRSGSLNFHLTHVETKWGPVPLRSVQQSDGTTDLVAQSIIQANFGMLGLAFFKGRNAVINAGDLIPAYIISGYRSNAQPILVVTDAADSEC